MPTGLAIAPQLVIPKHNDLTGQCGNCQSQKWKLHTKQTPQGARITTIICAGCQRQHKVNEAGVIQTGSKVHPRIQEHLALHGKD